MKHDESQEQTFIRSKRKAYVSQTVFVEILFFYYSWLDPGGVVINFIWK